jgi:hypothetical protein
MRATDNAMAKIIFQISSPLEHFLQLADKTKHLFIRLERTHNSVYGIIPFHEILPRRPITVPPNLPSQEIDTSNPRSGTHSCHCWRTISRISDEHDTTARPTSQLDKVHTPTVFALKHRPADGS